MSSTDTLPAPNPGVRTYKSHRGRLGARRRDALAGLLPRYGVDVTGGRLDPELLFGRPAPLVLEIGSGMGEATAETAAAAPDRDHLAAEVHAPGVANLLALIEARQLANLRVVHGDGLELLRDRIAPDTLTEVRALFPDPWPKHRHHKRRLFQPAHVRLIRSRLAPGGTIHMATDQPGYATAARKALAADPGLVAVYDGAAPPRSRPVTRYERRARDAGRPVFELVFRRV